MALIPLLPKTKGQEWPPQTSGGLHSISDLDYQRNLCENYYEASDFGTPSPLAYARVTADRLEIYLNDVRDAAPRPRFREVFERWALLLQGLFFDLLVPVPLSLNRLGSLGRILGAELPESFSYALLRWDDKTTVGFTDPRVGVAPGVRVPDSVFEELRRRIADKSSDRAAEYFARWVRREMQAEERRLLFLSLLEELARRWYGKEIPPPSPGEDRLLGEGYRLTLGGDRDRRVPSLAITMRRYVGVPITCHHCNYEIGKEVGQRSGPLVVRKPDDCRCPNCLTPQKWLDDYQDWIRYHEEQGRYLIFAFADSPARQESFSLPLLWESDGVVITSGQLRLKVEGLVLSEERIKCDRLTSFRDGQRTYRASLPVRGEYFGLVEVAAGGAVQNALNDEYVVPLDVHGWPTRVYLRFAASQIHSEEALLLVWPNFRLQGWNVYFYLLEIQPILRDAGFKIRLLRKGLPPETLEASRGMIEQPFDAFEMIFQPKGSNRVEHAGIFTYRWRELSRGETPATVAVDFGTSTTAVWFRVGDDTPQPLRFRDFTATVLPNQYFSDQTLETSRWVPTYRIDDRRTALLFDSGDNGNGSHDAAGLVAKMDYFMPSELIVRRAPDRNGLGVPILDFGICHPYGAKPDAKVFYEMKSLPPNGSSNGRFEFEELVSRYLEQVLLTTLAAIVERDPRIGVLKVRTSFPRAFSSQKLQLFLKAFKSATDWIQDRTGFVTNEFLYLDESRAAALAMPARGQVALVMDMGGGTTDIGVFRYRKGKLTPVLIDSLQYGGNDFLRLLANEPRLFPKPSEKDEDRLLWLFREVRRRGFAEVVRTRYTADNAARQEAVRLLLHFYEPVVYFVRRLFEALLQRPEAGDLAGQSVRVFLVGNGWSLAEAVPVVDTSLGADAREILQRLLEAQGLRVEMAGTPRPNGQNLDWPGPKAAVAYGALRADAGELSEYRRSEPVESVESGISSIVGFDLDIEDGSGGRIPVAWSDPVPLPLAHSGCRPLLAKIAIPAEWSFLRYEAGQDATNLEQECANDIPQVGDARLTRSVLARFIESVYKPQLANCRKH